jgi:CDP-diacylglycerol--serine O-phosphatidyltransferase
VFGSRYTSLFNEAARKHPDLVKLEQEIRFVRRFESTLAANGVQILKLWFHLSREAQQARIEDLLANPSTAWQVDKLDLRAHKKFKAIRRASRLVLDATDGRVARLTNTQSEFGAQYDSLSDMVSFGAAPALVVYEWSLRGMGKLGWLAAFVYVAGAALRLARFNTNITVVDKRFFQGMPSPAAAALVAGFVWIATDLRETRWIDATGADLRWFAWTLTLYAGLTMFSNAPFYSFKDINLKRSVPYVAVPLIVLFFVLVSYDPPIVLFSLFLVYAASGYVLWLWRLWVSRKAVNSAERASPN